MSRRKYDSQEWETILQLTSIPEWEFDEDIVAEVQRCADIIDPSVKGMQWRHHIVSIAPDGTKRHFESFREAGNFFKISHQTVRRLTKTLASFGNGGKEHRDHDCYGVEFRNLGRLYEGEVLRVGE